MTKPTVDDATVERIARKIAFDEVQQETGSEWPPEKLEGYWRKLADNGFQDEYLRFARSAAEALLGDGYRKDPVDADQDEIASAIDAMARHYIAKAAAGAYDWNVIHWDDYPELSAADFDRVGKRATKLAAELEQDPDTFAAAYALLTARASDQEPQP